MNDSSYCDYSLPCVTKKLLKTRSCPDSKTRAQFTGKNNYKIRQNCFTRCWIMLKQKRYVLSSLSEQLLSDFVSVISVNSLSAISSNIFQLLVMNCEFSVSALHAQFIFYVVSYTDELWAHVLLDCYSSHQVIWYCAFTSISHITIYVNYLELD